MRCSGHIDAVRNFVLDGWAANLDALEEPVTVELLADGVVVAEAVANRHRPDLKRADLGDGNLGFALGIPDDLFDGREAQLAVRVRGSDCLLAGTPIPASLRPELRPTFSLDIHRGERRVVRGEARNGSAESSPVLVDLLVGDRWVASTLASRGGTTGSGVSGCGFSFDLGPLWTPALLEQPIRCAIAGRPGLHPITVIEPLGSEVLIEDLICSGATLKGVLKVPRPVPESVEFDLRLNGQPLITLDWYSTESDRDSLRRRFAATLEEPLQSGRVGVSVCLADTGLALGAVRYLWPAPTGNLITNPLFDDWNGATPTAWSVASTELAHVLPEHCLLSLRSTGLAAAGPLALRFSHGSGPESLTGPVTLLAQDLPATALPPGAAMEVRLIAQSDVACHAELRLELSDGVGSHRLQQPVRLRPHWSTESVIVRLPPSESGFTEAKLSVIVSALRNRCRIAAIGFGMKGFLLSPASRMASNKRPPDDIAPGLPPSPNAVVNGDFVHWSQGLAFKAATKRVEAADGWTAFFKNPRAAVSLSVDKVLARDPITGGNGEERFGLALAGPAEGITRLETILNPLNLTESPNLLRFFIAARSITPSYGEARKSTLLNRVMLLSRASLPTVDGSEPSFKDETLGVIGRRVVAGAPGRYYEFPIGEGSIDWSVVQTGGDEDEPIAPRQIVLAFEFEGPLQCVVADVYLGRRALHPVLALTHKPGYVGLEDPNIAAQVNLIRGISHWNSPKAIEAIEVSSELTATHGSDLATPTSWRWPQGLAAAVEVVIPVFNAPDEVMACLASIERNTGFPHIVTIIDDASEELTSQRLAAYAARRPWIRLIRNPRNLGYTKSSNIGMSSSSADWVVLLNSDTVVGPRWLEGLLECAYSDPRIKFVGAVSNAASWQSVPEVFDAKGKWKVNSLPPGYSVDRFAELVWRTAERNYPRVPLLNGFCTLMCRQVLEELGYLDEAAFPVGYGEENDLCLRAHKAGHELAIAEQVYVYHVKSASFGSARREGLAKQGMVNLLQKHPDVDLTQAQRELGSVKSLQRLRSRLLEALADTCAAGASDASKQPAPASH